MLATLVFCLFCAQDAPESGEIRVSFRNRAVPRDAAHLTPAVSALPWRAKELQRAGDVTAFTVTFPSPVASAYECNNTVWCEFFVPKRAEPVPGVVVLHFLHDPGFRVTRTVCMGYAQRGIAALMVKLAYYGERRPPEMQDGFMYDPELLVRAWGQSVQDVRCAHAWLRQRPEVDGARSGIVGISLGAMVGALAVAVDAEVTRAALILGGGDLNSILWAAPETRALRVRLRELGLDRDATAAVLAPVEPLQFAGKLPAGTVCMVNAEQDATVPKRCAEALAAAFGVTPRWFDTGHVGLSAHLFTVLDDTARLFTEAPAQGTHQGPSCSAPIPPARP